MAFTEDHSEFLVEDDFAVPASVGGSSVSVVFDHGYVEVAGVQGEFPVVLGDDDDLSSVSVGDALIVNNTFYTVRVLQPDGTGMRTLVLEEVVGGGTPSLGDTRTTEAGDQRVTESGLVRITG